MSTLSVTGLVQLIQELPLLNAAQARELPQVAAGCADVVRLLKELKQRQWLTAYQAKVILTGEGKGLVLGPYLLVDLLGQGAMGRVYLARQIQTKKQVALKVIPPETLQHERAARRFQREVFAAAQLTHPNIVLAYEAGQSGQACYMAMEYIDGIDLSRLVKQNGPMPPPMACDLIRQAALGLQHAHDKDLIHRDIKPSNLMVVRDADHPPLIKVLDFGLARLLTEADGESRLTQVGGVVGTVDYISPEQVVNARQADARSDIFSLGATLFYILTGVPPYAGQDIVEKVSARVLGDAQKLSMFRGNLPTGLEEVVAKMLARDPAFRYSTGAEVARALEPFCRQELQKSAVPVAAVAKLVPDPPPVATIVPAAIPMAAVPVAAVPVAAIPVAVAPRSSATPSASRSLAVPAVSAPLVVSQKKGLSRSRAQNSLKRINRPKPAVWSKVFAVLLACLIVGGGGLIVWSLTQPGDEKSRVEQSPGKVDDKKGKGKEDKDKGKLKPPDPNPAKNHLARLLNDLKNSRWETRLAAAHTLSKMKADEVRPGLPTLVAVIPAEKDRRVQKVLVRTLAAIARPGDTKATELFASLVDDNDSESAAVAARALAKLAPERAAAVVKVLGKLLLEGKDKERLQAVKTLSRLGEQPGAIAPELGKALGDKQPEVRRRVARLLGRLGAKAAPAVPDLAKAVEKDEKVEVRQEAASALGSLRFPTNEKSIPALVQVIDKDPDPLVRQRSIWALMSVPDLDKINATMTLEKLLVTEPERFLPTSYSAAILLARKKGPKVGDRVNLVLVHLLRNKSMNVATVTGTGGDKQDARFMAIDPLVLTMTPGRPGIRMMLEEAARDMEPRLSGTAQAALKKLP